MLPPTALKVDHSRRSQEDIGGAKRSQQNQEEPGGARTREEPGGARTRRSQDYVAEWEPKGAGAARHGRMGT